jgi:O-antigen ligase
MKHKAAGVANLPLRKREDRSREPVRDTLQKSAGADANGPSFHNARTTLAVVAIPIFLGLAYIGTGSLALLLSGAVLLAGIPPGVGVARLRPLDWAMLLVLVYEIPLLLFSRYPANGLRGATTVCVAALFYLLARLVVRTSHQAVLVAALVGVGGVALACFAVIQFNEQVHLLNAKGLSQIVAFRAKLITPPAPWVLGEWFTLVLLTLPFAFAVPAFLWLDRRPMLAAGTVLMPIGVSVGLLLSCSRAVFWAVIVFAVVAVGVAAVYRTIRTKAALIAIAGALGVLGLVLAIENVFYPGVMEAYTGQHTSQVRSTEGRLAIWKRSAGMFRLAPVWGVGNGNAPLFLTSNANQEETTGFASRTFSLPLQVLTEKGAIGAALCLAVLMLSGWESHRKLRNPKASPQVKAFTCCLVAGVVAVLFRELTYSSLLEHAAAAMLFTMSLSLLVAEETA